jgi:tetratricopeptide (TPR) repeat protein
VINRHFDYFRDDNIYSSILLNRIQLYSLNKNEERIRELLKEVLEASPLDGRKVLAVALYYGQLEEYEKATELLQGNIDEDFMVPLNTRLLAEFKSKAESNESKEEYKAIVNRMIANVNFKNHDILYLIGRSNASDLLKRFARQVVKVDIGYKSRLMTNSLMMTLPRKWVLYGDNEAPSAPTIEYLNGELAPKSSQVNEETRSVTFRYDGFLPLKEFPGKEFPYELRINLPSRDMPVRLVAQYYKKEENQTHNFMMDQAWRMVGQGGKQKTVEVPVFEFHQLQTEDHCYTVENNSLQLGC